MPGRLVGDDVRSTVSRPCEQTVLAGAPIDTDAGDGPILEAAHRLPMASFKQLVAMGGGLLKGTFMLQGFKNMHPDKQYVDKFVELYEHIDHPSYVSRF
jgi:hypothetical protein